jgi:CheY-like chemotaxis protein
LCLLYLHNRMKSILIIDDSDDFRGTICDILLDAQYDVWDAACPEEAFKVLGREKFDVIVCDLQMPFTMGEDYQNFPFSAEVGVQTIQELSGVFPFTPIIAVSALPSLVLDELHHRIQTVPILGKPFHPSQLVGLIEQCSSAQFVRAVQ